mgnify:CR=1 FL=1
MDSLKEWENGDALPDTGILLELSDLLNTTVDKLLNGGSLSIRERSLMRAEDVIEGFRCIECIGACLGEECMFYTALVNGINIKIS